MKPGDLEQLPYMLYADEDGRIYDHPYYRMAGFSGSGPVPLDDGDLIVMPEFSKLFFIPDCPPVGVDPATGEYTVVGEITVDGETTGCRAVAAFLEPGYVRSHLPAADYSRKEYILPMWAYTAVGFKGEDYVAAAFEIERNPRWDPRNYDDRDLMPAIEAYRARFGSGPLVEHLVGCATLNHCFAAKNVFLGRWEAPLPVSRTCNASCLGCLSLQADESCDASHHRITFLPSKEEIVSLATAHLTRSPKAIVSFGQGCEGEPLTEHGRIAESIRGIREITGEGTINLNTNGSRPDLVREVVESGLDSIRISLNSARPDFYRAYYRPRGYDFEDVVSSIALSRRNGLYTMVNYLVFPGITDQDEELEALSRLIEHTGLNFIHLKNLCIDPLVYMEEMPDTGSPAMGLKHMVSVLEETFPHVQLGYFNQPVRE